MASHDWIFHLLAGVLGLGGLALGIWALFWDRSRGRRRCPKCWYLMEGVPEQEGGGFVCPECGKRIVKKKRFLRTRRHWRWAMVACLLWGVGYGVYLTPQIRREGWIKSVPASLLMIIAPVNDDAWEIYKFGNDYSWEPTNSLLIELLDRVGARSLRDFQYRVFFNRLFQAQPEMAKQFVHTRPHWPAKTDIRCRLWIPSVLFIPGSSLDDVVIRARLRKENSPWVESIEGLDWINEREPLLYPDGLPPGDYEIEAEIYIGVNVSNDRDLNSYTIDRSKQIRIWQGITRTIQVSDIAQNILIPHASPTADEAIRRFVDPMFFVDTRGRPWLVIHTTGFHIGDDQIDWSLGAKVEIQRDEVTVAQGSLLYSMTRIGLEANFDDFYDVIPLAWIEAGSYDFGSDSAKWSIQLKGSADVALSDLDREIYWNGQVVVPAHPPRNRSEVVELIEIWDNTTP